MLFKLLIILHTLGATVWTGGHLVLLLGTLALAIHARFFIIPNLSAETLKSLAFHIVGVTTLAVLFVVLGAGIRLGGLT
ncbi:hypothetical protein [Phormidium sp. FACHB-1136]|jgi:hypothetical protein|uniref:hypothetical protein n=1 Tax=Phormidium sp. FACHB-1136 TaxID=2692848 RepID=UPI001686FA83|nr:hypothetical protein [Phormidium sp. FACHB-1136]MBD2425278.1 hypothetical protein [Phormidium sp. FACHB-1136]